MTSILVFDTETVPDVEGYARVHRIDPKTSSVREMMGDAFPKLIFHKIVCVSALIAHRTRNGYEVGGIATQHVGEMSEKELISRFLDLIEGMNPKPTIVTFNGHSFDMVVLRYRAMIHGLQSKGLFARQYFHRYSGDHIDLCDVLSSFNHSGKATLDEVCRVMGLAGKAGMDGTKVEEYVNAGRITEVGSYCQSDVINTYRLFLKHEFFTGRLSEDEYVATDEKAVAIE